MTAVSRYKETLLMTLPGCLSTTADQDTNFLNSIITENKTCCFLKYSQNITMRNQHCLVGKKNFNNEEEGKRYFENSV